MAIDISTLNSQLSSFNSKVKFADVLTSTFDVQGKLAAAVTTKLGTEINQVVGGFQALTQQADTAIKKRRPVFLWGPPGIGKSDIVKQIGEDAGREVIDVRLALWEPTDIKGIPYYNADQGKMVWAPPAELPTDPESTAIIFLDELNSAPPAVQAAAYQLILNRRVGTYELPKGVDVVAADDDMLHLEDLHRILDHTEHVEIGVDHHVGHVPMHEQLAWLDTCDHLGRDPAVGTADPEEFGFLPSRILGEKIRAQTHFVRNPGLIVEQQSLVAFHLRLQVWVMPWTLRHWVWMPRCEAPSQNSRMTSAASWST